MLRVQSVHHFSQDGIQTKCHTGHPGSSPCHYYRVRNLRINLICKNDQNRGISKVFDTLFSMTLLLPVPFGDFDSEGENGSIDTFLFCFGFLSFYRLLSRWISGFFMFLSPKIV